MCHRLARDTVGVCDDLCMPAQQAFQQVLPAAPGVEVNDVIGAAANGACHLPELQGVEPLLPYETQLLLAS